MKNKNKIRIKIALNLEEIRYLRTAIILLRNQYSFDRNIKLFSLYNTLTNLEEILINLEKEN